MSEKAPPIGAFFLLVFSFWLSIPDLTFGGCTTPATGEEVRVAHVYDGDTVELADGRNVRLIGIDTPEIGRDGARDKPGATAALARLRELLTATEQRIYLIPGSQETDRYDRVLAHVYDQQGRNLTEILLTEGLGLALVMPPNLGNLDCYLAAEAAARKNRAGLWRLAAYPLDAGKLKGKETGFHLIHGRIERVGKSRYALWLNIERGPAVRIDRRDWANFSHLDPEELAGRSLEVRGWIYRRNSQPRMQVRHPRAIRWLD